MVTGGRRTAPASVLAFLLAGCFAARAERPLVERRLDELRCAKRDAASCVERLRARLTQELDRPEPTRSEGGKCAARRGPTCFPVFDECTPVAGLVLRALSELDEAGASATPEVFEALRRRPELEPFVFDALVSFRRADVLPLVVQRLESGDSGCRWNAFQAIQGLDLRVTNAVPRLNVLLLGQDWEERTKAANALALIGDHRSIGPLILALSQEPASAQRAATQALGSIGTAAAAAVPKLERLARTHWAWSVRHAAADAVSKITRKAIEPRRPSCRTSAREVGERWIVTTDGKEQTLDPVQTKSPPGPGRGACGVADAGWELFPLLEDGETCIAGENLGEWGGRIVVLRDRRREVLGQADAFGPHASVNPLRAVRFGSDLFVIEGLEHVFWGGKGSLVRLSRDPREGWRAEPFFDLPGVPVAFAIRDERLVLLAKDALDRDDQPCPDRPGTTIVPYYLLKISADGSVESLP